VFHQWYKKCRNNTSVHYCNIFIELTNTCQSRWYSIWINYLSTNLYVMKLDVLEGSDDGVPISIINAYAKDIVLVVCFGIGSIGFIAIISIGISIGRTITCFDLRSDYSSLLKFACFLLLDRYIAGNKTILQHEDDCNLYFIKVNGRFNNALTCSNVDDAKISLNTKLDFGFFYAIISIFGIDRLSGVGMYTLGSMYDVSMSISDVTWIFLPSSTSRV